MAAWNRGSPALRFAKALGLGRSKTYELIQAGKLETVTIGRRRLVRAASVRALALGEAA